MSFALYTTDEFGNPHHVADHATLPAAIADGRKLRAELTTMGQAHLDVWVLDDATDVEWDATDDDDVTELDYACPACGEASDYCQGHGEIGDPIGYAVLGQHYDGDHADCHPNSTYCYDELG